MGGQKQRDFAKQTIRRLRIAGFQALWAGGCVRDMLRQAKPKDYDIATSAKPQEVKDLFRRTLMVGAKFGVVIVLGPRTQVEVATFRRDLAYKDGRHPERVVYTDAEQDARRRDFTINGMFYDPFEDSLIDYVGGEVDLRRKIIRCIGQPKLRFAEDHLRMLRAVRFACTFDFTLEDSTAKAIADQAGKIKKISPERIAEELLTIIKSPGRAHGIRLAGQLGLLKVIIPEVDYTCAAHRLAQLNGASAPAGLACLLYGLDQTYQPKESARHARAICKRLKLSNQLVDQTAWLVETARGLVTAHAASQEIALADLKRMLASGIFRELLWLYRTIAPERICRQLRTQSRKIDPKAFTPTPLIAGKDLKAMGVRPSPKMGKCLEDVYEAQLNELVKTKPQARKFVRDWLDSN